MDGDGLTDDELAYARTVSEAWMPDTAHVLRNTAGTNAIGGREHTWGTVGTVACRVFQAGKGGAVGSEAERAGALVADSEWTIVLPFDTDVTEPDRIEVGSSTFDVTEVDTGRTSSTDCIVRATLRK